MELLFSTRELESALMKNDGHYLDGFASDAAVLLCFFSPVFDFQEYEVANNVMDLHTTIESILRKLRSVCDKIGANHAEIMREIGAGVSAVDTLTKKITKISNNMYSAYGGDMKVTAADYRKMMDNNESDIVIEFPHTMVLLRVLAALAPTEASCERAFSVMKRVMSPHRSSLSVENAAMNLEVLLLDQQKVSVPAHAGADEERENAELDLFGDAAIVQLDEVPREKKECRLTSAVAVAVVNAAVKRYQKLSAENGSQNCEQCKRPLTTRIKNREKATIQCKNHDCAKTWCYDINGDGTIEQCVMTGNSLRVLPSEEEMYTFECKACKVKKLGILNK